MANHLLGLVLAALGIGVLIALGVGFVMMLETYRRVFLGQDSPEPEEEPADEP